MTKLVDIAFMALVVLVLIGGFMEAREKQKLRAIHRSA
jgi:hypothetical protein